MTNPLLGSIAKMREQIAALELLVRTEFEHLGTAMGDALRDLDDIKSQVKVRKADKRVRGAGRSPNKSRI